MRSDLESRRRAIARAFRLAARPSPPPVDETGALRQTVIALAHRVEELSREVEALRVRPEGVRPDSLPVGAPLADEEPPGGRATVPPVTPAKLSSQAFDVLLGTVSTDRATSRSA